MVKVLKRKKCNLKKELKIGIEVERKEHGKLFTDKNREKMLKGITSSHIKEFNCYYTHKKYGLLAIEKKIKKELRGMK